MSTNEAITRLDAAVDALREVDVSAWSEESLRDQLGELSAALCALDSVLSSQGRVLPGIELRIVTNDGTEAPWDGETFGEIQARGNWVASAYYKNEAAAEISNRTVHGVVHLGWVDRGEGRYQGEMAVYVKPRGAFGKGYMLLIKPFRHLIVYPAMLREGRTSMTDGSLAAAESAVRPIARVAAVVARRARRFSTVHLIPAGAGASSNWPTARPVQ